MESENNNIRNENGNNNRERLTQLFRLYYNKTASEDQRRELMELIQTASPEVLSSLIREGGEHLETSEWKGVSVVDSNQNLIHEPNAEYRIPADRAEAILAHILKPEQTGVPLIKMVPRRRWWRYAAAAAIIIIIGTGSYFLFFNKPKEQSAKIQSQEERFKNDVAPGINGAVLTLANGKQILLDSSRNGIVAVQGISKVTNKNGQIIYDKDGNLATEVLYNTMTTPKGRQYQLVLSDGTKVWLNAASSIRFPITFTGKERKVEIRGEAYFEVAKDATKKFIVSMGGINTEVLGTHFNVNGFGDEAAAKITLLEGRVKVNKGSALQMLSPGEQAEVNTEGKIRLIAGADLDQVMAWKNGKFIFKSADIATVMRQAARWYDVEIVYNNNKPVLEHFNGELPRNVKLSDLLKAMELSGGVRFGIEGRKIIVMP